MAEYWLDADSLITAHRGPYSFAFGTKLWDFLEERAREGVISSPEIVLSRELASNRPTEEKDNLELWAKELRGALFLPPDDSVQEEYGKVVNYVQNNGRFAQQWIAGWLSGADPWIVAYPMALGGRIVTFEKGAPKGAKIKIPDVAHHFGIKCISIWEMLTNLGFTY